MHLQALERAYGCKLCIGPCITRGEGFYYDAYYGDVTLNEAHFGLIEAQARKAVDVCILFNSISPFYSYSLFSRHILYHYELYLKS